MTARPDPTTRWHSSSGSSPSIVDGDSDSEDELLDMITAVRLSSTFNEDQPDDWPAPDRILSDLSTDDFERQARANSLAASQAMIRGGYASRTALSPPHPADRVIPPRWATESRANPSRTAPSIIPSTRPPQADFVDQWYQAPSNHTLNDPTPDAWKFKDPIPRGWRQPHFQPGRRHEEVAARDRLQPPALGGRSKKDSLGSVNASWGPLGEAGPKVYGMFEIEQDPPSRSTSPFKEEKAVGPDEQQEAARGRLTKDEVQEAMERARDGMRLTIGGSDWSAGISSAVLRSPGPSEDTSTITTISTKTTGQGGRYDEDRDEAELTRYVNSAFGSQHSRSAVGEDTRGYAQTPQSSASRDVFGPRRLVQGGDDGW